VIVALNVQMLDRRSDETEVGVEEEPLLIAE